MQSFTAHRLHFATRVQTTIELNEHQGSAIRGSLFHAMRRRFCGNPDVRECAGCPLVATCPVATLLSTLRPDSGRGQDVPRPYTVQPPLPGQGGHLSTEDDRGRLFFRYHEGERFEFGLTLYAQALQLFPYVVLTVKTFEQEGIGRRMERDDGRWRRGCVRIEDVWAENPLTGDRQQVLDAGDTRVQVPDVPLTNEQIHSLPLPTPGHAAAVRFLTPTRLIDDGQLVKPHEFRFKPLLQRLLDRLESLSRHFSDAPLAVDFSYLVAAAEEVCVLEKDLRWEELRSYSTRQRRGTPTSGLLGTVVLRADDWAPFWHLLQWGQFTHVGKDAVKGNGWYALEDMG
jgi:hypothetical protein